MEVIVMALKKQIIKENGTESNYHKISRVDLSISDDQTRLAVEIESYLNEEYRKANKPNDRDYQLFVLEGGEDTTSQIRPLAYSKIKELAAWADAEDC
jgi:hypothetical protein